MRRRSFLTALLGLTAAPFLPASAVEQHLMLIGNPSEGFGFVPVSDYGDLRLCPMEIGYWENVRFIMTEHV